MKPQRIGIGYDVVGDIAITETPRGDSKKEKELAGMILEQHKNIKSVARKVGAHKGVFRLQKLRILAGKKERKQYTRKITCC